MPSTGHGNVSRRDRRGAGKPRGALQKVASYELFAVAVLFLLVLARPQWGAVAVGLLLLLWLVRWLGTGRLSIRTPLDWCVVAMALSLPASLWISADLPLSLATASRLVMGLGLFYAAANSVVGVEDWRYALAVAAILAGGSALALFGLLGVFRAESQLIGLPQQIAGLVPSFTIHVNVLATALVVIAPLAGSLALWGVPPGWPGWGRPAAGAAALLMLTSLLITRSRGALVGLIVAVAVVAALRWSRLRWPLLVAAALALVGLFLARESLPLVLVTGLQGREAVWQRALTALRDFPLTGVGFGLFGRVVPILYPYFDLGVGPLAQAPHAHNLYLQVAADVGLPGLIGFAALLLVTAWLLWWLGQQATDVSSGLLLGLVGGYIALLVHGLVDAVAWSAKTAPLLWLVLGLITVLFLQRQREVANH